MRIRAARSFSHPGSSSRHPSRVLHYLSVERYACEKHPSTTPDSSAELFSRAQRLGHIRLSFPPLLRTPLKPHPPTTLNQPPTSNLQHGSTNQRHEWAP